MDPGSLAPPPRHVSSGAKAQMLFGPTLHQMGWVFLLAASFVAWIVLAVPGFASGTLPLPFIVAFFLVAFLWIGISVRDGLRNIRLLTHGVAAKGTLESKKATNVMINNRRVFDLVFAFKDAGGQERRATVATPMPETVEDSPTEHMLYDPERPEHATTVDSLPGSVQMDSSGGIEAVDGTATAIALAIPVFTVAANLAAAAFLIR